MTTDDALSVIQHTVLSPAVWSQHFIHRNACCDTDVTVQKMKHITDFSGTCKNE